MQTQNSDQERMEARMERLEENSRRAVGMSTAAFLVMLGTFFAFRVVAARAKPEVIVVNTHPNQGL